MADSAPFKCDYNFSFFQNIAQPQDTEKYGAILDFVLSSEVLRTVIDYMHCSRHPRRRRSPAKEAGRRGARAY